VDSFLSNENVIGSLAGYRISRVVQQVKKDNQITFEEAAKTLRKARFLVLSADAVLRNGGLIGSSGALLLAVAAKELGVPLKDNEVSDLLLWFDTNASGLLDYNEFTRQLFGDDIQTRTLTLPKLSKKANAILLSKGLLNPTVMQHTRPLSSPLKQSLSNNNLVTNNEFSTQRPNSTTDIKMNSSNDSSSTYSLSNNTFGTSAAAELSAVYWKSHNRETMKDGLIGKDKIMQLAESRAVKEARRLAKRDLILEERSKVQKKLESVEAQRRALIEDYKARKSVKIITKF
jgi:hypothetical protein